MPPRIAPARRGSRSCLGVRVPQACRHARVGAGLQQSPDKFRQIPGTCNVQRGAALGVLCVYVDGGVGQADFLQARDAAELRDIFAAIGVELSDADFAATYETATKMDPSGLVSVESFRRALNAATMPEGQQTVSRYPFAS